MIGFLRWERTRHLGEIGFFIREPFRRQQYATEACRAVMAFGFRGMALLVVQAKSLPSNVASVRVLENIGMRKIARLREPLSSKGEEVDLDLYAIDAPCGDR
jgi:RimJ/RimL family protein N-acetyltransferase